MPCSPKLKSCVDDLIAAGQDEDSAWAICRSKLGESVNRSRDFQRIHDEFLNQYPNKVEAETQYYDWIHVLQLDETKSYQNCQESYLWKKEDIQFIREDADNKYYEVELGFPTRSMNGNVYKKRDLIAASLTLPGKSPSLNHKDEFWFSHKNPKNRWGNIEIVEGKFHENRSKALMKVPKTMVCPICNGGLMTELIDKKQIYNVSLEGDCKGGTCVTGECEGFQYLDPPFTLLTTDILPGIPMTRIKPLESIMVEALQLSTKGEKRKMKIEAKIKEDHAYDISNTKPSDIRTSIGTQPNDMPLINPDEHSQCPEGYRFSTLQGGCIPVPQIPEPVSTMAKVEPDLANTVAGDDIYKLPAGAEGDHKPEGSTESKINAMQKGPLTPGEPMPNSAQTDPPAQTVSKTTVGQIPHAEPLSPPPRTPGYDKTVTGKDPVWSESLPSLEERKARLHAEMRAKSSEEKALQWEQKHDELYKQFMDFNDKHNQTLGVVNEQKARIATLEAKRDEAFKDMHNSQIERDEWHSKYEHQLGIVEDLRTQIEKVREELSRATEKYGQTLKTNLELSQKLTRANEDYLEVAKAKEETEEKLTAARTNAKKTLKLKL